MMPMNKFVESLCKASVDNELNYFDELKWPESLDINQWFMSPELLSIYGTKYFDSLTIAEQQQLSFYELLNFFSMNIHGERHLMSGMSQLFYKDETREFTKYLHHFLAEENQHIQYFARFCNQYGKKIYPDTLLQSLPTEYQKGEEEFLYFAKVMVFEECLDRYNVSMSKDERLPQIVRSINRVHHLDESRHLAFGRRLLKQIFEEYSPGWSPETTVKVRRYVVDYIESFWRDLFNFRVYRDIKLAGDAIEIRDEVINGPTAIGHYNNLTAVIRNYFITSGILLSEPVPSISFVG